MAAGVESNVDAGAVDPKGGKVDGLDDPIDGAAVGAPVAPNADGAFDSEPKPPNDDALADSDGAAGVDFSPNLKSEGIPNAGCCVAGCAEAKGATAAAKGAAAGVEATGAATGTIEE
jgi:hypothetical protein